MKYILIIVFFLSTNTFAARFEKIGNILEIVSSENNNGTSNSNLAAFSIKGFTSAGSCYVSQSEGHVIIRIRDNAQGNLHTSMLMAAFVSGKKVQARVDDSNKENGSGVCYLEQLRIHESY